MSSSSISTLPNRAFRPASIPCAPRPIPRPVRVGRFAANVDLSTGAEESSRPCPPPRKRRPSTCPAAALRARRSRPRSRAGTPSSGGPSSSSSPARTASSSSSSSAGRAAPPLPRAALVAPGVRGERYTSTVCNLETGEPPAYLLDLAVRNVRCFGPEEQTLRLSDSQGRPAPWTVILGDNGVGKTTLLQCLVALEPRRHFFGDEGGPLVQLPVSGGDRWRVYRDPRQPKETSIRGHVALGSLDQPLETVEVIVPTSPTRDRRRARPAAIERRPLRKLQCYGYGATRRMGSAALGRSSRETPL